MSDDTLAQLLASKEVIVVCGPGGVGKTTVAATAGLLAAQHLGGRVLVLTVDPARRLATALGLGHIGNDEVQVDPARIAVDGAPPMGELWVAQLDTKASWDALIRMHAPDAATRDQILGNQLYENITGTFVQSHDYIAMERLHELHASGRFDLIVVDTPPSRNAVDFLDAPERMAEFFGSRLLRWLTVPYRSRLFTAASRPFYNVADRILGQQFLREIADFFVLFQTMDAGFVARAEEVQRTLRDRRTSFMVVSSLEPASIAECEFFIGALAERRLHLGAVVLNRVLPAWFGNTRSSSAARKMLQDADQLAGRLDEIGAVGDMPPALTAGVLREVAESFLNFATVATRQRELRNVLGHHAEVVVSLPYLADDIVDVDGLARLADTMRRA
jgi:anion-transporting  ArsA/GET3 family ATPase